MGADAPCHVSIAVGRVGPREPPAPQAWGRWPLRRGRRLAARLPPEGSRPHAQACAAPVLCRRLSGCGCCREAPRGAGPSQFLREKECPEQLLGDHQSLVLPAEPRLPRAPPSACSLTWPQSCTNKRGQSSHAAGPTCGRRRALRLHDSSRKSLLRTGRPGGCAHLSFFQKRIPRVRHGTKCCTCELARGTGPPSGPLLTHAHTCLCQQGQGTACSFFFFWIFMSLFEATLMTMPGA